MKNTSPYIEKILVEGYRKMPPWEKMIGLPLAG
jgi:hypothetical protein